MTGKTDRIIRRLHSKDIAVVYAAIEEAVTELRRLETALIRAHREINKLKYGEIG